MRPLRVSRVSLVSLFSQVSRCLLAHCLVLSRLPCHCPPSVPPRDSSCGFPFSDQAISLPVNNPMQTKNTEIRRPRCCSGPEPSGARMSVSVSVGGIGLGKGRVMGQWFSTLPPQRRAKRLIPGVAFVAPSTDDLSFSPARGGSFDTHTKKESFRGPWRRAALGAIPNHAAGTSPRTRGGMQACSSVCDLPVTDSSQTQHGCGGAPGCGKAMRSPISGNKPCDLISSKMKKKTKAQASERSNTSRQAAPQTSVAMWRDRQTPVAMSHSHLAATTRRTACTPQYTQAPVPDPSPAQGNAHAGKSCSDH